MKSRGKALLYALHILVPLLAGAGIYVFSPGDTYLSDVLRGFLPECRIPLNAAALPQRILRNYFCDAAWAYALTFSVIPLIGSAKRKIFFSAALCACFSACLEFLQLRPGFAGTFDPADLVTEALACMSAGLIFYKQFGRK